MYCSVSGTTSQHLCQSGSSRYDLPPVLTGDQEPLIGTTIPSRQFRKPVCVENQGSAYPS
jgi:hypothetical protein